MRPDDRRQPGRHNTKVLAISDGRGPPLAFNLTLGQAAACKASELLLASLPARCIVDADRAYDSNRMRDVIEKQGAIPSIPPKLNCRWESCFSKTL